ncbi:M10 family metallopeptidase C-terminal domain-containing protein [Aquipseudomonas campi]|uniref:M10 family metallopeptidase C-terminal domain-containing protein n=1 Tax=Aquipseudomonas campi TaxID=2731681 RepID=A0A6M8G9I0_9GAMM|nr:calcium-binding protein [Pseudomonas campi]QKE65475.1 M10 family metallopeptidase C-terminal domain-containing protein [Pseudomonas campi]
MAIVNGTQISEILNGTAGNDEITGRAGDDTLLGGAGEDAAIYSGSAADYLFSWENGHLTITDKNLSDGNDGTDTLQGIEEVRFSDSTFAVEIDGLSSINTTTPGDQRNPSTTLLSDGGWIIAWQDSSSSTQSIYTQRYDSEGNKIGIETKVNNANSSSSHIDPAVSALPDGGWLIAWSHFPTGEILSRRYDATGEPVSDEQLVSTTPYAGLCPPTVITLSDGGWLISWEKNNEIISQQYDASGTPVGSKIFTSPFEISPGTLSTTALVDGSWLITWGENQTSGHSALQLTATQHYSATGELIGETIYSSPQSWTIKPTTTALADGGWLIAWTDDSGTMTCQRYNAEGEKSGEPSETDLAFDSFPYPASIIGLADGGWLITTGDSPIKSVRFDSNGNQIAQISTNTIGDSMGANVTATALADGGWLLTWQKNTSSEQGLEVLSLRYDADGIPQTPKVQGTDAADTLVGSSLITLAGGLGNDIYIVNSSNAATPIILEKSDEGTDTVYSSINYYKLADNIEIGRITTADKTARLEGNSLNNTLFATSANQTLDGGDGIDTASFIHSTAGVIQGIGHELQEIYTDGILYNIENITGSNFNDVFYNSSSNNVFDGALGSDTVDLSFISAASTINLSKTASQNTQGAGSDTFINIENLYGSRYNDNFTGNAAGNVLNGRAGNDVLDGREGADWLIGGDGSDTYFVDNTGDIVSETNTNATTGGTDTVNSYLSRYTLGANIENGRITASSTASLTGNSLNNILYAGAGNNVLNGGSGSDTASYLYAGSAVTVSLANTAAQATGGSGSDTLTAIENLTGSNYNDKLTGNSANNKLSGGLGNDVLNGGAGADNMIGGDGSDNYYVDHASDVVSETNADASTGGTDTIFSYLAGYNLGTNIENARILATGSANLTGNSLNNVLMAGNGNNVLNGGSGIDTASYAYAGSAVTISLSSTSAQATKGSGSDTLTSIENLTGSNYNDTLIGNSASNTLNGGSGNDRLTGGAGKDTLIGGAGNDVFAFIALADSGVASNSWDIIKDFVRGADKIDLSKLDANTAASGDNAFNKIIDGAATFTAAGQLKVFNGVLYGNTDGDIDAEFAIQLIGVSSISLADFIA